MGGRRWELKGQERKKKMFEPPVSFNFNVSYSSCWGYSLINTFKLNIRNGWQTISFTCALKYRSSPSKGRSGQTLLRSAQTWITKATTQGTARRERQNLVYGGSRPHSAAVMMHLWETLTVKLCCLEGLAILVSKTSVFLSRIGSVGWVWWFETRMPHERTRRPAHPSSPSLHTSPGRCAKGAFPTGPMGDRAHAMADWSSQDRRERTGEDAQRVACTRATLQVGRGGCNAPSMYCDTNLGKLVDRSTPNSYIRCFLPQPFVPACPMPCPCLRKRSVCACLPYFLCLNRFELSGFCVRSAQWACARASTACAYIRTVRYAATECTPASRDVGIFLFCNM